MSIFTKLNTLFRAGVRESAEALTDANAIRIYRQEIIDAESLLTRRRDALAAMIAARKEVEDDIREPSAGSASVRASWATYPRRSSARSCCNWQPGKSPPQRPTWMIQNVGTSACAKKFNGKS